MSARPVLFGTLTVGIGAVLLFLFIRATGISRQELGSALRNLHALPLMGILVSTLLSTAAGSEKWRLVEGRLSGRFPPRRHAFGLSALGSALGMFMPAPIASALARGGGTRLMTGEGGRRGALSSAWEQLFDIAVIGLAAVPALVALRLGDFRTFLFSAPILAVLADLLIGPATHLARRVLPQKAAPLLDASLSRKLYRLSLVKFLALIGMTLGVAAAIGSQIPTLPLVAAVPPVAIAGTLSFVPAGLGVNEWTFVFILGLSGVAPHPVATFAVMNRLLVGSLSIALGLVSAVFAYRASLPAASSESVSDDPYRDGTAGDPLYRPLQRMQPRADQDEDHAVA